MRVRYAVCVIVGIGMAVAGVALVTAAVYAFTRAGICAADGSFVRIQECSEGIGRDVGRMVGGVAGIMLGPVVFAARGRGEGTAVSLAGATWGMFWIAAAAAVWTSSRGVDSPGSGHEAVTTALTVVFAVMGAVPLVFTLVVILVGRPALGRGARRGGPGGGDIAGPGNGDAGRGPTLSAGESPAAEDREPEDRL